MAMHGTILDALASSNSGAHLYVLALTCDGLTHWFGPSGCACTQVSRLNTVITPYPRYVHAISILVTVYCITSLCAHAVGKESHILKGQGPGSQIWVYVDDRRCTFAQCTCVEIDHFYCTGTSSGSASFGPQRHSHSKLPLHQKSISKAPN